MTQLDWLIVAFAALLALFGYRQGFIVGVLSFAGFAAGAFLGTRIAPLLLPRGSASPYAPAFGLIGALLAGAMLASGMEGVAFRLRRMLVIPGTGLLDGILGAMLGAAIGLAIVWIAAAFAAQAPVASELRAEIQHSAILRRLNTLLPPSGPILGALARLDPLPSITGPLPGLAPPAGRGVALDPGARAASHSVVRVIGDACGLAIEGSGWVAAPDLVVTNAHVVAGEEDTSVEVSGQAPARPAVPVAFDAHDDLAVLRVGELGLAPLSLAESSPEGEAGAILGYPENGPFDAESARIGRTQAVLTDDAYGHGPVSRVLTPLRGRVRPGNSGGPLVNAHGQVLTTVFAGTVGGEAPGGYGVANETVAHVLAQARSRAQSGASVSTGPCAPA